MFSGNPRKPEDIRRAEWNTERVRNTGTHPELKTSEFKTKVASMQSRKFMLQRHFVVALRAMDCPPYNLIVWTQPSLQ